MVLLHLLAQKLQSPARKKDKRTRFIIAHFDHGIREDSDIDWPLVKQTAERYGLSAVYDKGNLGPDASEAAARKARYEFLHRVREAANAGAIVTAHHQDDMIETAIINMMRGTGRRGMSSLKSTDTVVRPLLHVPKKDIYAYAKKEGLQWHEDPTNTDTKFLRNYIRHKVVPSMDKETRKKFVNIISSMHELNQHIDATLINHLHLHPATHKLDRHWFTMLPHAVAREVMAAWLRREGIRQYDKKTLERLVMAGKTMRYGGRTDISSAYVLKSKKNFLELAPRNQ